MKAVTLLAPLAVAGAALFAAPSHAAPRVGITIGAPGFAITLGGPVVYEPPIYAPPPPPVVVVDDPYWVWVPGVGYRYWTYDERVRWEHVHRGYHLFRRGEERGWREHEVWQREHYGRDWDRRDWDRRDRGEWHGRGEHGRVEHGRVERGNSWRAPAHDVRHQPPARAPGRGGAGHARHR